MQSGITSPEFFSLALAPEVTTTPPKTAIDLAVSGGDILPFTFAVDEELPTLLSFDVVNLDAPLQDELRQAIEREGVILYEKDEKLC